MVEQVEEISEKNKKGEILEAYRELVTKMEEKEKDDRVKVRERREKLETFQKASDLSVDGIVKGLSEVKLNIGKGLDQIEDEMIGEFKRFAELRRAIDIAQQELEEVHDIKVQSNSLVALQQSQKEARESFEQEMTEERNALEAEIEETREEWETEKEQAETGRKECAKQLELERKREEEEYIYNRNLTRKREEDAYEERRSQMEKELAETRATVERDLEEREANVRSREGELERLTAQVEAFPEELQKATEDAAGRAVTTTEDRFRFQIDLAAKEREGERQLFEQKVQSLETKIREQETMIQSLTNQVQEAGHQVQGIAIKAIEGASSSRPRSDYFDRGTRETTD